MFYIVLLILAVAGGAVISLWRSPDQPEVYGEMTEGEHTRFLKKVRRWKRGVIMSAVLWALLLFLPATFAASLKFVKTGHVAVMTLFNEVQPSFIDEGAHFINPFLSTHGMSVKLQEFSMTQAATEDDEDMDGTSIVAISSDGLKLGLDVTVTYSLDPQSAPWIYQNIGKGYRDIVLQKASREAVREAARRYTAQDAYSQKREDLAADMQIVLQDRLEAILKEKGLADGSGIIINAVLLRNVGLPDKVIDAIEEKLKAEQEAQRMEFILIRETQEAERKRIEAAGIRDFQQIVREGIDEQLLRWKGIEATERLAESDNAKIVVVGGKDGLPLILNTGDRDK